MEAPRPAFAHDQATAEYYDRRAAEYDEWYEGRGQYAARDRPGWREDVSSLVAMIQALEEATTLDIACGTGFLTRHLRGVAVGIDQSRRMVAAARTRLPDGAVATGDALDLPFADGSFDRVLTAHFYGHLHGDERLGLLAEARRVAPELIVVDSAWRPGVDPEQWQPRVLNDGSRHQVYKRYLRAEQLAEEIGGEVLWAGSWFVVARRRSAVEDAPDDLVLGATGGHGGPLPG